MGARPTALCVRRGRPPGTPCAGRPECPNDEERLEEESCEPLGARIESEGIVAFGPLSDVAGKDYDEESGDDPADGHAAASQEQERETERDLHEP